MIDRFTVELRNAGLKGNTLVGHAAVFGQIADLPQHYEQLDRHAFDEALKTSDARFLVDHNPSQLLGRQSSGTLRLSTDDEGLAFEVDLPDTQLGRDIRELVRRGDLSGASFGFIPGTDSWSMAKDGRQMRTHTSVAKLLDASVVTFPAYDGATVALRSLTIPSRPPSSGRSRLIKARHALLRRSTNA